MNRDTLFSRRKMLIASTAALTLPVFISGSQKVQASSNSESLSTSDREVSIMSKSDDDFNQAVEESFPGLQNDPVFKMIAPLAALVIHHRGPAIKAYTISYAITTQTGTYEDALFHYSLAGGKIISQNKMAIISGVRDIIKPAGIRLVTPYFSWTPEYFMENPQPNWEKFIKPVEPGAFLTHELQNATQVKIGLNGVIFSDHKIVGPDNHMLARRFYVQRNAEHDEGLSIWKMLRSNASDSEIADTLLSHYRSPRSNTTKNKYWYTLARRRQAGVLYEYLYAAGREKFSNAIELLVSQPKTKIARATA